MSLHNNPSSSITPIAPKASYYAMQEAINNRDYQKIKELLDGGQEISDKNYMLLSLIVYFKDTKALYAIFSFYKENNKDLKLILNLTLLQAVKLKDTSIIEYLYVCSFFTSKEFELAWCQNDYSLLKMVCSQGHTPTLQFLNSINSQFFLLISLYKEDWKIKNKDTLSWFAQLENIYTTKHNLNASIPLMPGESEISKV